MKLGLLAAAATALLAASPVWAEGEQCFFTRNITNFTVTGDEKTLYLRVSGAEVYRVDLSEQCSGLAFKERIELKSYNRSPTICSAQEIDPKLYEHGATIPCFVSGLHRMTPEEIAAIPKKFRP